MAELFVLEPDDRLERLRDWIVYQWAFKSWYCFWPTEAQIVTIAGRFKVLCETVINECDAEFIRHCEPNGGVEAGKEEVDGWQIDGGDGSQKAARTCARVAR